MPSAADGARCAHAPWRGACLVWPAAREPAPCDLPQFPYYTNASRVAALREFVLARVREAHVVYWITPKAAHITIVNRLMRRPPFEILDVASADLREEERQARLARALAHDPFEFTFVREPVGHVASAIDQMRRCRALPAARSVHDYIATLYEFVEARWPSRECRELHLYPQMSGYPAPGGIHRLHFVGRLGHFAEDWATLLGHVANATDVTGPPFPVINARRRPRFLRVKAQWRTFATHPMVRAHTEWDARCFDD
jgi:hypothetical protein